MKTEQLNINQPDEMDGSHWLWPGRAIMLWWVAQPQASHVDFKGMLPQ